MLDFAKLIKDVGSKTTIEDSVDELLVAIANEIMEHPGNVSNTELATRLIANQKAIGAAVSDNLGL